MSQSTFSCIQFEPKKLLIASQSVFKRESLHLGHDGERIHVWAEVVQAGEKKITAELVQRKVDEFKASSLSDFPI